VTKLPDADQQLAALVQLMQAASYSADPYDLAQRVISGLIEHFATTAGAIWLYAPPQHIRLHSHNLEPIDIGNWLEQVLTTRDPLFAEVESPSNQPPATQMLSMFPFAVEQATLGALVVVTPAPLAGTARLVLQALAGYLGARLHAMQTRQIAEQRQIELATSNQGWNEFIGHAAHEIKNPLASVKGYADLLLRRANDTPGDPFRKGLTIISQQTSRATELLSDMSERARIDGNRLMLNLSIINLTEWVQRFVQMQNDRTSRHAITLECEDEPIYCRCDQTRLTQVFQAMLSNAIKFSPNGESIAVRLQRSTDQAEPEVIISVSDNGVGVPAEEQHAVFDRFKRGSNIRGQFSGLGLGLYAAREIVKRHGGRMWLESTPGHGTTCFVALPIHEHTINS
jgi:signal transduction histidine kinase